MGMLINPGWSMMQNQDCANIFIGNDSEFGSFALRLHTEGNLYPKEEGDKRNSRRQQKEKEKKL